MSLCCRSGSVGRLGQGGLAEDGAAGIGELKSIGRGRHADLVKPGTGIAAALQVLNQFPEAVAQQAPRKLVLADPQVGAIEAEPAGPEQPLAAGLGPAIGGTKNGIRFPARQRVLDAVPA